VFTGSINRDVKSILAEHSREWVGKTVYVGCSGNFNVERILGHVGISDIHSNDVSLYSCALGTYLSGGNLEVGVKDEQLAWLEPYLSGGIETIATIHMCLDYLLFLGHEEPYHKRMKLIYENQWKTLHAESCERILRVIDGFTVSSFMSGDVVDFLEAAPADAVVVTFPPPYELGYERLYKEIDSTFSWNSPSYTTFNAERFAHLTDLITDREHWMTMRDEEVEGLSEFLVGRTQTSVSAKPVYVYSGGGTVRVSRFYQKTADVPFGVCEGELDGEIRLVNLNLHQINQLRSRFLSPGIAPAKSGLQFAVLSGDKLIGAVMYAYGGTGQRVEYRGRFCDVYLTSDFAVGTTKYKKLSKLVLAVAVSKEARAMCEQEFKARLRRIGTTAFTEKASSMKYRGLMKPWKRAPGSVNYVGEFGRWTIQEGHEWWKANHSQLK